MNMILYVRIILGPSVSWMGRRISVMNVSGISALIGCSEASSRGIGARIPSIVVGHIQITKTVRLMELYAKGKLA